MFQEKCINCLIWCHFKGMPKKIPVNYPFNPPPSRQISNWTPSGVLGPPQLAANNLTFDLCTHYLTNLSTPLRKKKLFCLLFVRDTRIWQIAFDDIWGCDGAMLSARTASECVPLTDWSQGQPKDRRAKHSSAIAAGKHTQNSLTLMDYSIFSLITQTYVWACLNAHTRTHTHTQTPTSVAAYRNTDGHRPATSVSPSVNPCETDSDPSTGHTDAAIIPLNKLSQSKRRLPQAVGTAARIWYTSGVYRLLVNCCYSASMETQKRHLQKWREVK